MQEDRAFCRGAFERFAFLGKSSGRDIKKAAP
jgi:hypothetical protein